MIKKAAFLAVLILMFIPAHAAEWPQYMSNPQHNAVIDDDGLKFPLCTSWKKQMFGGMVTFSPPLVDNNGIIYVVENNAMEAVDVNTGNTIWTRNNTDIRGDIYPTSQYNTGVLYNGKVIANNSKTVIAIKMADGTDAYRKASIFTDGDSFVSRISLNNGKVYIGTYYGKVAEIDADTGNTLRVFNVSADPIYASPSFDAAGNIYIGGRDSNFYCIDVSTGLLKWKTELLAGPIDAAATITDDGIFFGTGLGYIIGLETATGRLMWKKLCGSNVNGTGAVKDGKFYIGSNDCYIYSFDCKTGFIYWKFKCNNNFYMMSCMIIKTKLIILGCRGAVIVIDIVNADVTQVCYSREANHTAPVYWGGNIIFFDVSHMLYAMKECLPLCGLCTCKSYETPVPTESPYVIMCPGCSPTVTVTRTCTATRTATATATLTAAATRTVTATVTATFIATEKPTPENTATPDPCGEGKAPGFSVKMLINPEKWEYNIFEITSTLPLQEPPFLTVYPHGSSGTEQKQPVTLACSAMPGEENKFIAYYQKRTGYGDVDLVEITGTDSCGIQGTYRGGFDKENISGKEVTVFGNVIKPGQRCRMLVKNDGSKRISVKVYNRAGVIVSVPFEGPAAGMKSKEVIWDGNTSAGEAASAGIYVAVIETADYTERVKIVVLK